MELGIVSLVVKMEETAIAGGRGNGPFLIIHSSPILTFTLSSRCNWKVASGPGVGAAWDREAAPAPGESLAEATMGQTLFFVWSPSLIKLSRGVIGF